MSEPLRVEPSQLRYKAWQINAPWTPTPTDPQPPCGLDLASVAVRQIYAAADGMRQYVAAGQAEATRLSQSLNAAADAYEVDDYVRASVVLGSGVEAWVYLAAD